MLRYVLRYKLSTLLLRLKRKSQSASTQVVCTGFLDKHAQEKRDDHRSLCYLAVKQASDYRQVDRSVPKASHTLDHNAPSFYRKVIRAFEDICTQMLTLCLVIRTLFSNRSALPESSSRLHISNTSSSIAGLANLSLIALLGFCSIVLSTSNCQAGLYDDRRWSTRFGVPGILTPDSSWTRDSITVACLCSDGSLTYVGGRFQLPSLNVCAYDASQQRWLSLGDGLDSNVRAICIYKGRVVAAGAFRFSGSTACSSIAEFDPNTKSWQPLGSGLNGDVGSVCVFNNELYAAGKFEIAGGIVCRNIARWDGNEWRSLGSGATNGIDGSIRSMCVYRSKLLVAGDFDQAGGQLAIRRLASWDGSSWSNAEKDLGIDLNANKANHVYCIAASDSLLCLCGRIERVGIDTSIVLTPNIIVYDGQRWLLPFQTMQKAVSAIRSCCFSKDDLYFVGDSLQQIDNTLASGVVRWSRSSHRCYAAGSGISDGTRSPLLRTLCFSNNQLTVGGRFVQAGGRYALNIATYDPPSNEWLRLNAANSHGFNGPCIINTIDGEFLAAGLFTHSGENAVAHIGRWDGQQWLNVGNGIPGSFGARSIQNVTPAWPSPVIKCITKYKGEYLIGGDFVSCGGLKTGAIVAFDGATLHEVGGGMHDPVDWSRFEVSTFLRHDSSLYVGGAFVHAGMTICNSIARWDGSNWHALDSGITYYSYFSPVQSLHLTPSGSFLVGGAFWDVCSVGAHSLARWDAQRWSNPTGQYDSLGYLINCMSGDDNDLYVAGYFPRMGGTICNSVAHWDGQRWTDLAGGISNGMVYDMKRLGNEIYICGLFSGVGDIVARNAAVWNISEQRWHPLGSGLDADARSIAIVGDTVFFAGYFQQAGRVNSAYLAAWLPERSVQTPDVQSFEPTLLLSPQPAHQSVHVQWNQVLPYASELRIIDAIGRNLKQVSLQPGTDQLRLNIQDLPNGLYVVQLRNANSVLQQQLIVAH